MMRIAGVSVAFPERVVSNKEVLELIEERSESSFEGDLSKALRNIRFMLRHIGIRNRRWMSDTDYSFDFIQSAINGALDKAQLSKDDVDLLIYASVDKRVIEPGMAFFAAKAMGMKNTECFDVTEACGGWVRSTQIAQSFLQTGLYKNILIVTAEFANHEGQPIVDKNYRIENYEELEWSFASYTLGEAATATVLTSDDDTSSEQSNPWIYDNVSMPEFADLCILPLGDDDPSTFLWNGNSLAGRGALRFVSNGLKMHDAINEVVIDMISRNPVPMGDVSLYIPHTNAVKNWLDIEADMNLENPIPYDFLLPEYGNLANNSMPAAIAMAEEEGRLKRGENVAGLMTAAGMSLTSFNFKY